MRRSILFELKGNLHVGGFRPFMWKIASEAGLSGWIANSEQGVLLRLEGEEEQISEFIRKIPSAVPNAFYMKEIRLVRREPSGPLDLRNIGFRVTGEDNKVPLINPDKAPCPKCVAEAETPASRRFTYPFSSCFICGPTYSFALRTPFVRKNTSMTAFPMCSDCKNEKNDTHDIHHYASETLACPKCGPQVFLLDMYGELIDDAIPMCRAQEGLHKGEILAVQSIYGGFLLCADAFNADTVMRLRRKKKLPDRPLSLLARNIEVVKRYFECSPEEERLLASPIAPVVILKRRADVGDLNPLPALISPDTDTLGVGLPPSLLEKLLFDHDANPCGLPGFDFLVTCGDNRPGKAECLDIDEIFNRLMAFTDKFLCHDLKTGHACPASICTVHNGRTRIWRRSRGYVPQGIPFNGTLPRNVGAFGTDVSAAIAFGTGGEIMPSQGIGTLESREAASILSEVLERFMYLTDRVPDLIVCDMDKESFSAREAAAFAEKHSLPLVTVQAHHAHALTCMAEHGLRHALALVFNGGGYGPDGTEWGAECLESRLDGFCRFASFSGRYRLETKDAQLRPAKLFLERLIEIGREPSTALLERLRVDRSEYELWKKIYPDGRHNCIFSHAAVRLYDAVCAGIGIAPDFCTYDMRCLLILNKYAARCPASPEEIPERIRNLFAFDVREEERYSVIDWSRTFLNLAEIEPPREDELPLYAKAFYAALADAGLAMVSYASRFSLERAVVLSGTLFMDEILSDATERLLTAHGYTVYQHEKTPADESGICTGQAYAAGMT